jgi:hypothetical protein
VRLSLGPDAQFANAERLERLVGEAAALLRPAALVCDLEGGGGEGGGGVGLDCSGAVALLALPSAAGGAPVALYGLGAPQLRGLAHCARALFKGAKAGGAASAASVAAAVACARLDGAKVGELHLLPNWGAAQQWAAEVCATAEAAGVSVAVRGGGVGSLQAAPAAARGGGGDGYEPLLAEPGADEEAAAADDDDGRVAGVDDSPLSARAMAARRAAGVPLAQSGAQLLAQLRAATEEKATGSLLARAEKAAREALGDAAMALSDSSPLLVGTV